MCFQSIRDRRTEWKFCEVFYGQCVCTLRAYEWQNQQPDLKSIFCRVFREIGVMNILITPEGHPVFWDGKGNFSLEKNDDFSMAAHFQKVLPGDDPEAFRQKAAEQLGIDVQYEEY
jgi:hypothetical protein